MINKEKIHELVEVFYQPNFKTFYVNSVDGKSFIKPIGVFISLGITTSKKVLEDIKGILNSSNYSAVLAEISSKKVKGQFLNTLTNIKSPEQYELLDISEKDLDEKSAKKKLSELKMIISDPDQDLDNIKKYTPEYNKLKSIIEKIDSLGWDSHLIQEEDNGNYRVRHRFLNYKKEDEVEYRIGIYVCNK